MALLVLQLLLLLALAPRAAAQSNRCTAFNLLGDACDVQSICTRCTTTDGCMFDIFQGRCDTATTSVKYCGLDDDVCGSCTMTGSRPVCYGRDARCICPSLCTAVKSPRAVCGGEEVNVRLWLTFGAFALVLPLLLYMQRKWNEPGGVQHMIHNRRLRRQRQLREQQRDTTRDLELSTWRDHRELFKLEMRDVELKTCYLQLDDATVPTATGALPPPPPPGDDPVLVACERGAAPLSAVSAAAADAADPATTRQQFAGVQDDESKIGDDDGDAELPLPRHHQQQQQHQIAVVVVEKP